VFVTVSHFHRSLIFAILPLGWSPVRCSSQARLLPRQPILSGCQQQTLGINRGLAKFYGTRHWRQIFEHFKSVIYWRSRIHAVAIAADIATTVSHGRKLHKPLAQGVNFISIKLKQVSFWLI
jgi:hypothetical protein